MPNRRTFFATAASGIAWLLGIRAEKPAPLIPRPLNDEQRRQFKAAWVVTMSTGSGVVTMRAKASNGTGAEN